MFRSLSTAVLLLLLALPGVALAQSTGTLTGTVVDNTGETLPGAAVRVEGTTLGAVTNIDGEYRIIGVPVGTFNITASFTGYQPETQTGVSITASITRVVDFTLSSGLDLEEVIVSYERPIIERGSTAPRAISGEDIQNLPVRNVTSVVALQSGVVEGNGGGLNIRGGRGGEVAYYVDGVRISGNLAVNQSAIAEQEMLIGTIPARYGDVQSGVVSITTLTGRSDFFGSVEGVTSTGLDSYGYNLGSFSLGGPIIQDRIGFFLSGEGTFLEDASPYGIASFRLNDETFDLIQRRPQAMQFEGPDGERIFIPFPAELLDDEPFSVLGTSAGSTRGATVTRAQIDSAYVQAGVVPDGFTLVDTQLTPTPSTLTEDAFDLVRGKDDPSNQLTLNGNLNFTVGPATLRLGGGYQNSSGRSYSYANSFYNRDYGQSESEYYRTYGTIRQRVGTNAFYQLTAEYQNRYANSRPEGYGDDLAETLFYGDVENERYAVSRRYFNPSGENLVRRNFRDSNFTIGSVDPGLFGLPGSRTLGYSKSQSEQFGVSGDASTQVGVHQIGFGGEFRQSTNRAFSVTTGALAEFFADGTNVRQDGPGGNPEEGVTSYDQLSYQALKPLVSYYGYTFNGLEKTSTAQDVDAFFEDDDEDGVPNNTNIDAWRPYYYAGFITDRIEFSDLIFDLGFRVDAFNANTLVLRDLYANQPIFRASDLRATGFAVPSTVEDDYGVYYAGGEVGNQNIVGYRDLQGTIYDRNGGQITASDLTQLSGRHAIDDSKKESSVFRDSETDVTFMPRVGVSFPVTNRALFFASYNVISQRPTQAAFTTFNVYERATGGSLSNTGLAPQRTTQYELGFRQRVGERAALSISGFYRTQDNLIALQKADGGLTQYNFYQNKDFSTSQGAELGFELRRTNNLAVNANYTLSFAKATGSDANTLSVIAWRGNAFPNFISPADFDQRHTANVTVDYRFGRGEGPMFGSVRPFENFGINMIGQFGSGQRYTPLERCGGFDVNDSFTCNTTGSINSSVLPANYNFDLKLDRRFNLGFTQKSTMQLYLLVLNVLDTKNVYAVYRETGQVDNQGFFSGSLGASRLAGFQNPASTAFNYQAYAAGPVNNGGRQSSTGSFYGSPRRVRLGALFTF